MCSIYLLIFGSELATPNVGARRGKIPTEIKFVKTTRQSGSSTDGMDSATDNTL